MIDCSNLSHSAKMESLETSEFQGFSFVFKGFSVVLCVTKLNISFRL